MTEIESEILARLDRIEKLLTHKSRAEKKAEFSESFLKFWAIYPATRKGNKDRAYKAYLRAVKRGNAEEHIFAVAQSYALSKQVAEGYAKGCEAWLNDDRFNLSYEPAGVLRNIQTAKESGMRGF